jgi:hypothetical protein
MQVQAGWTWRLHAPYFNGRVARVLMLWWLQVEDKRVVLDDIDWGAVAKAIGTRNHAQCMERWYKCQVRCRPAGTLSVRHPTRLLCMCGMLTAAAVRLHNGR